MDILHQHVDNGHRVDEIKILFQLSVDAVQHLEAIRILRGKPLAVGNGLRRDVGSQNPIPLAQQMNGIPALAAAQLQNPGIGADLKFPDGLLYNGGGGSGKPFQILPVYLPVPVIIGFIIGAVFHYTISSGWKTSSNRSAVKNPRDTQASFREIFSWYAFFAVLAAFS